MSRRPVTCSDTPLNQIFPKGRLAALQFNNVVGHPFPQSQPLELHGPCMGAIGVLALARTGLNASGIAWPHNSVSPARAVPGLQQGKPLGSGAQPATAKLRSAVTSVATL